MTPTIVVTRRSSPKSIVSYTVKTTADIDTTEPTHFIDAYASLEEALQHALIVAFITNYPLRLDGTVTCYNYATIKAACVDTGINIDELQIVPSLY